MPELWSINIFVHPSSIAPVPVFLISNSNETISPYLNFGFDIRISVIVKSATPILSALAGAIGVNTAAVNSNATIFLNILLPPCLQLCILSLIFLNKKILIII